MTAEGAGRQCDRPDTYMCTYMHMLYMCMYMWCGTTGEARDGRITVCDVDRDAASPAPPPPCAAVFPYEEPPSPDRSTRRPSLRKAPRDHQNELDEKWLRLHRAGCWHARKLHPSSCFPRADKLLVRCACAHRCACGAPVHTTAICLTRRRSRPCAFARGSSWTLAALRTNKARTTRCN